MIRIAMVLSAMLFAGCAMSPERIAELKAENPHYRWEYIEKGKIIMGMRPEEARLAWGHPWRVNSRTGSYGTRDQWVYRNFGNRRQYVYFSNGIVSGWGEN